MNKNVLLFCLAAFLCTLASKASNTGDYRTRASGDWSNPKTWQTYNGTKWVTATVPPDNNSGAISIINGHTVTVNDTTYVDQLRVRGGAVLHVVNNILYLKNGAGFDLWVEGKLIIDPIARVSDDPVTAGSTVDYQGDTLIQGGGFQVDLTFDGPNPQFIKGNGYGANLTVDNGGNLTILGTQSYNGANFKKGKIIVPGFFLMTQYSHVFTGANNNRYIDGNIALLVYDNTPLSFTLPLGTGGHYLPVVFNVQSNSPSQIFYNVSLNNGPAAAATLPASLDRVYTARYVNITTDQPGSITAASLQMSYDTSDHITDRLRLRLAHNEGGAWVNLGGKGTGTTGTVTSGINFTTLGDFVLADSYNSPLLQAIDGATSGNLNLPDVYKIRANGDGKLKLNLLAKTVAVTATLLDGDSATVLGTLPVAGGASGALEQDGLAAGYYFVKLLPATAGQLYTYQLSDTLFKPAEAANEEPDSTITLAKSLTVNGKITGHIGYYYKNHRDSVDWFRMKPAAGRLQLTIASKNSNAVTLTLYNSTGTTNLGSITAPGNSTATLQKPGLAKGTYFIKITAANSSEFAPYIVTDTLFTPSFTASVPKQESIVAPVKDNGAITDVFTYPNPAPTQFRLQLSGAPKTGTVSLALKNSNGETVWSNTKAAVASLSSLTVNVSKLPAGIYFLQVTGEDKKVITKKIVIAR